MKGDNYTRDCGATTKSGDPCKAKALRDSDPPRCINHARTPEERVEAARKAARRSAEVRRAHAAPRPRSGLAAGVTIDDVLAIVADGLTATFADAGLPNEADWPTRLLSALALVSLFPPSMRKTPEEAQGALERALPPSIATDPEAAHRLNVSAAYTHARKEWNRLRLRYSPLIGLYVEEYPPFLIAPWEDRQTVLREERPPPVPPREAADLLVRTSSGELYIRRDGALPLLIPED